VSGDVEFIPHTWPCPGKPEELKGQPIGQYHCEYCGEMQIAGMEHLPPQFPEFWAEPFPKIEWPEGSDESQRGEPQEDDGKERLHYFDRQGKPITLHEWAALWEDFDYRLVKKTHVGGREVVTVWEGFDPYRTTYEDGPPRIFNVEDVRTHDGLIIEEALFASEAEALDAHHELVRKIGEAQELPPYVSAQLSKRRVDRPDEE
jgi:hypothetical protein